MPLRALAKMTSGAISMGMMTASCWKPELWVIGLVKVILRGRRKHNSQRATGEPPAQQLTEVQRAILE